MEFDEIQAVHFERIIFGIKNFDLALISKDFITFRRINSIPMEHIEDLKSFFDEIGVVFCEGPASLTWTAVLAEIRNNFEDWLEDGGWNFLNDDGSEIEDGAEGAEEDMEEGDPEAEYGSEDDEESESSFGSGEDDESFSDEDESDDGDQLSEEGLSWDELDKMAEEEDRKASSRRVAAPAKKPAQNKRPQGKGKSGRY